MIRDYCREIESYLCRKNDGHLIRIVGPSFEMVSRWSSDGVPLKIAFQGIDRYFERYYRKGPRRRPVRIDFCEADVLDVFDEWRRATGLRADTGTDPEDRPQSSLPAHLERVVLKLSNATVAAGVGEFATALGNLTSRVTLELDRARAKKSGVRGEERRTLVARLARLDQELVALARTGLDDSTRSAFHKAADEELVGFRDRLSEDAYWRAHTLVVDRLARERFGLPTIAI